MKKHYLLGIFLVLTFFVTEAQKQYDYPEVEAEMITDIYFEDSIADPYQWMENPQDPRLESWLEEQSKLIEKEERKQRYEDVLYKQLRSMYVDVDEYIDDEDGHRDKFVSKYQFKSKNSRVDRTPDLYVREKGNKNYRLLVKIKDLRHSRNEKVKITNKYVNTEHDLVALELSRNGSDWRDIVFFDLETGDQLPDTLNYLRTRSNLVWHGRNVYYDRFDIPVKGRELLDKAKGQTMYYHTLGSPQLADKLLFKNFDRSGTHDFSFFQADKKLFFYHYLKVKGKLVNVISAANFDAQPIFLKNFLIYPTGNSLDFRVSAVFEESAIIKTNWNAPQGRVIKVDIGGLNKSSDLVPEYDATLTKVSRLGKDKISCIYRNEGRNMALIYDLEGSILKKIDFKKGKKVNGLYEDDIKKEETLFSVSSFYHPNLYYNLNLNSLMVKPHDSLSVPYNPEFLETRYVKYVSKDGTEIPMYISCLKGTKMDGSNPTLLYGYGGYGTVMEPSFNEIRTLWMLHGGILAVPNVRGGGAEGTDWSEAGRRLKKQNTIDDFIAAAEYLIDENYTTAEKLGIEGSSHGGLLVGAAAMQRPELFKAVIADAGAFDLLRFEKYTVGSVETNLKEFGQTSNREDYENLKSYSPLHNVRPGIKYPDMLLFTGDSDDRVPPFHSYKFMATLQANEPNRSKFLLYVVEGAGHSGPSNSADYSNKMIFKCYFLFDTLGLNFMNF